MAEKPVSLFLDTAQLAALGALTAHWTFFETEVEFTISCLSARLDGNQAVPFGFKDKIKRWRRLARRQYTGKTLARCESMIDEADEAHDIRSILSHGRITGRSGGLIRKITVTHHRHRASVWEVQPYDFPPRRIGRWANDIGRLSARLIRFNAKNLPGTPKSLP